MSRLGNVGGRLYRGEVSFDFVGRQKLWYSISGLILVLSLVGLFARGLNFSVDFKGGSVIQFPATSSTSLMQVNRSDTPPPEADPLLFVPLQPVLPASQGACPWHGKPVAARQRSCKS